MKIQRNDPCNCGSGKKFKKCCMHSHSAVKPIAGLPPFITCNECGGKAPQETYEILDTDGMDGINIALTGTCQDCESATIAISGDPDKAKELMQIMNEEMFSGDGKVGADIFKG